MGEILEITFVMWVVAIAAFAPLGYFIYLFTKGSGQSFGKSDPADHSVEEKKYYHLVNDIMNKIMGGGKSR